MELLRKIAKWLQEPGKTKSEKWATENNAGMAYKAGYDAKMNNKEEGPNPYPYDKAKKKAYELGINDADCDIERQW